MTHWHVRKKRAAVRPAGRLRGPETKAAEVGQDARPTLQPDLLDAARGEFARALAGADLNVTQHLGEWDRGFARAMAYRAVKGQGYTPKMRAQLDRLIASHGHRVHWSGRPDLKPVRSATRVAYVPDEAAKLLNKASRKA